MICAGFVLGLGLGLGHIANQDNSQLHHKYIIITIVQSYTEKYHEFVAVCIVTSAQHE